MYLCKKLYLSSYLITGTFVKINNFTKETQREREILCVCEKERESEREREIVRENKY